MNRISTSLAVAVAVFAGLALHAEDFQPLLKTTRATWPEKQHIGVICDYSASRDEVMALAKAAGEGALITVADTRHIEQATPAAHLIANHGANYLVLLPGDRVFRDGSFGATLAISQLGKRGVPALGTTAVALKQGAVFSMGDGTKGELLVTDRLIGTVDVILPNRTLAQKAALVLRKEGMATIAVLAAE
ncbi:hypothetical protein [Geothrix campi]|jgi:hypothetical protein|uniref:hypothetical protein n=1 Tax=Geothrix campi TaxID=2966450 RepID=UPI002147A916|nr:hypothetical protein [Geothrix sp. SG10]